MSNLSCGTHVAEPPATFDCRKLLNQDCRFLPKLKLPISADAKIPLTIAKGEQKSISFVGGIYTTREPDGNADLPINNWKINLLYNIEDEVSIPIEAEIAKGNKSGYFWRN